MRKVDTIQKENKLNDVYSIDEKANGGANHAYIVCKHGSEEVLSEIYFQKGGRNEFGSLSGVIDTDLLEIARDRLISFQSGEFANKYNEKAIFFLERALYWLDKRVQERAKYGLIGREEKIKKGN